MTHVPNGPAVFYRGDKTILVEDGVQPEGWFDNPGDAEKAAKRNRKAEAGVEAPFAPADAPAAAVESEAGL